MVRGLRIWNRINSAAGRSVAWSPAEPGGPYLTLVARLPELAEALAGFRRELRRVAPAAHHYQCDQLHTTILNLDGVRGVPLGELRAAVSAAISGCGGLTLNFGGPDVSPRSVYLSADGTARLTALRHDLRRRLGVARPRHAVATDRLAFCNVMRFASAGSYRALAGWLRTATAPVPRITVGSVELVETDKVLSADRTRVLARFALPAPS